MRNAHRRPASPVADAPRPVLDLRRRGFLLSLSAGAIGAAAASSAVAGTAAGASAAAAGETALGYRETEHVRDYYRTTRI